MRSILISLALALLVSGRTSEEKEMAQKAIRMKTTRQLKEIFEELGVAHKGLSKEELKKKAYKDDLVGRWEKLHPEKAYKKPKGGDSRPGGGIPGMGGDADDLLRQMRGDFSGESDPERRRILEKLAKKGLSFGGGSNMDTEQLKNMEKMMDGINVGGKGAGIDLGGEGDDAPPMRDSSEIDPDIGDEDKMEL